MLADESSLKVVYLKQITDVSEMQPHVTEAFVHFLAYRIAYRLRPDTQDTMYRIYRDVLSRSKFYDGSQNPVEVLEPNHLLEARLDGTQL